MLKWKGREYEHSRPYSLESALQLVPYVRDGLSGSDPVTACKTRVAKQIESDDWSVTDASHHFNPEPQLNIIKAPRGLRERRGCNATHFTPHSRKLDDAERDAPTGNRQASGHD